MEALGLNPGSIAIHAVNFIILLFVLQRFLYKPVIGMLDDRARKIRESVEAADRARAESARADQERAEVLRQARTQAEETVTRAMLAAGRVIGRSLDDQAHRDLVEQFLANGNGRADGPARR